MYMVKYFSFFFKSDKMKHNSSEQLKSFAIYLQKISSVRPMCQFSEIASL